MLESKRLGLTEDCRVRGQCGGIWLFVRLNAFTGFSLSGTFLAERVAVTVANPFYWQPKSTLAFPADAALAFPLLKIMKRFLVPSEN